MIRILAFGRIAEITGITSFEMDVTDTAMLQKQLEDRFPELTKTKYRMAVNKEFVMQTTKLEPGAEVALLPPFSGG